MRARVSRWMLGLTAVLALVSAPCSAAEPPIPPAPKRYFNDAAGVVDATTAQRLNSRLADFERQTSNQLLVVINAKLPEGTFLEDYTVKCAQAWGVGGKQKDNGVVLFVFIQDRKLRIEVGYGLEGALPDGVAKLIIENEIKPSFKAGNYAAGVERGMEAIIKATKNEYHAATSSQQSGKSALPPLLFVVFFLGVFGLIIWLQFRNFVLSRGGVFYWSDLFQFIAYALANSQRGSGNSWGGGSSGGSSSDFSGGGGSFGGGGASGDW